MKKIFSTVLATAMMLTTSAAALAAADDNAIGFKGGVKSVRQDITQLGGAVGVPFGAGEGQRVRFNMVEGAEYVSAEYDAAKQQIELTPATARRFSTPKDYEIAIEVTGANRKDLVEGGFSITGQVRYDDVQWVENSRKYRNEDGVLYDFGSGARNVTIEAGNGAWLHIPQGPKGEVNLRTTTDGNAAIDYMFSRHELRYVNFVSKPKFPEPVTVTLAGERGLHVYEYAGGVLARLGAAYDEEAGGYTFQTRRPATYILANAAMNEGVVNEEKYTVRPIGQ